MYGRRRVGKTYLVNQIMRPRSRFFELTGTRGGKLHEQLRNFSHEFARVFEGHANDPPMSWQIAFEQLTAALTAVRETSRKVVLFFDELPWLASPRSGFLRALDYAYNRHWSRMKHVVVIVCGSAASWMIKRVIGDKGGLHGRLTQKVRLRPFDLSETEQFLHHRQVRLDRIQIIDLYMAIGGIAKYLELCIPGRSATQQIETLCFSPTGYLRQEFELLLSSLFGKSGVHRAIIKHLAAHPEGLSEKQLIKGARLAKGGSISAAIEDLMASDFVLRMPQFGQIRRDAVLRVADPYSHFYLKWIESTQRSPFNDDLNHWAKQRSKPGYQAWAGRAFERVCLQHVGAIKQALGISGVLTRSSSWRLLDAGGRTTAQIDLVIDRDDHCINLCEIKYASAPWRMTAAYARRLIERRETFIAVTKTRKAVFNILLAASGATGQRHLNQAVDAQVSADVLFFKS